MRERQALIFGSLITLLFVAGALSAAVYFNLIPAPFDRTITRPSDDPRTLARMQPCPPEGTMPASVDTVTLDILNGAGINGLAARTATDASARGFIVLGTGNAPTSYEGDVQLVFGVNGLAAAYTFASHLVDPLLVLDNRDDPSVTVVLGKLFAGLKPGDEVTLDPTAPLTGVPGCIPVEDIDLPEPTQTPVDEETPPADPALEEAPADPALEEPPADPALEEPPGDPALEEPPIEG